MRIQKGASDTTQGNDIIFEAEDVGLGSVSSTSLYKCLSITWWFDRVGEEANEQIFFLKNIRIILLVKGVGKCQS